MTARIVPIVWFRDDPLPGLIADPAVIIGGTRLLKELFDFVAAHRGTGSFAIAAPYVGDDFVDESRRAWEAMDHAGIDLRVVVRRVPDARTAARQLTEFPWRTLQIGVAGRLHAKMYAFVTERCTGASLVGSHNLSRQGTRENLEAGVLMVSRRPGALSAISDVHEDVCARLRLSTLFMDTTAADALMTATRN